MERRRASRPSVELPADYRPRGGVKFSTFVLNLSAQGGCIETGFMLRDRSDGWLQLPTLADWHAHVVWRRGSQYGLEFAKPFHAAVVTMLLARASAIEPGIRARPGNDNAEQGLPAGPRPSRREQILSGVAVPPTLSFLAHQLPPN